MPYAGTLEWLHSNPKYSEWVENRERTLTVLTVYGQSGSGKTTLGHHLVHDLRERLTKNGSATGPAVTSYYFDKLDARRRSYRDFLLSLLRQLLFLGEHVYHHVEALYKKGTRTPQPSKWTHEDLWLVIRSIIACEQQQKAPFICVVDGLDECGETKRKLLRAVGQLPGRAEYDVRFAFFTQRGWGQGLEDEQKHVKAIDLDEEEGLRMDRVLVAECELSKSPESMIKKWDSSQLSKTTFLETALLMDHHSELPYLLEGPPPYLPKIYDHVMKPLDPSIHTAESPEDHILKLALPWITYSCYPLTIGQLATAIALESNPKPLSVLEDPQYKMSLWHTLESKLGRLLQVTDDRVCFAHRNIRDMFSEKALQKTASEVHSDLAEACLKFLCMEELSNLDPHTVNIDSHPWLKVPNTPPECSEFLLYAARYWPEHYRESMGSSDSRCDELFDHLKQFFATETRVKWWSEVWPLFDDPLCFAPRAEVNSTTTTQIEDGWRDLLSAASYLGVATVVSRLLKLGDLKSQGGYTRMFAALNLGAASGWCGVVQVVIDLGDAPDAAASINDIDALKIACENGHESVVGLLLRRREKGKQDPILRTSSSPPEPEETEPSTEKTSSSTTVLGDCLCLASEHGHVHVVQQLLVAGASASYIAPPGRRPHLLAASNGYDIVLRKLLDKGIDLAATDADGRTALQLAAMNGHLEAFRVLDPTKKPEDYPTLLDLAARNGRLLILKELQKMEGCDLERQLDGNTALHVAAENGHVTMVAELLKAGVNPSPIDKKRRTPLHLAASNSHPLVVEQLLSGGAEPDPIDSQGRTPLAGAIVYGRPRIAEKLLEFGAAVESSAPLDGTKVPLLHLASYYAQPESVKVLLANGANPTKRCTVPGFGDCTALHLAYDNTEVLELLLEGGAEANAKDSDGRTTLYLSISMKCTPSAMMLLARKDGKDTAMIPNQDGITALHYAVVNELEPLVQFLIKECPPLVTAGNIFGQTPLFYAVGRNNDSLVQLLLQAPDADIYLRDYGGWMPIHWAVVGQGSPFLSHCLAKYMQSTEPGNGLTDNERKSLLALAASKGSLEVINILLDKGFKVDEYDTHYGSALLAAAQNGHVKIVERLMEKGADPAQQDDHGWSPTLCATLHNNPQLLKLLRKSAGADSSTGLEQSENAEAVTLPPTAWCNKYLRNISLAEDGKVARNTWSGPIGSGPSDVDPPTAVARANHPLPARGEISGSYFEITITNAGKSE